MVELARTGSFRETPRLRVGDWLVDPPSGELTHLPTGRVERLEPRVMQLLCFLAERPGQVVSRDELLAGVWQGSFVTDDVVRRTLASLRKGLGDEAKAPSYVETLPRRGYRLLATVEPEAAEGVPPATAKPAAPGSPAAWSAAFRRSAGRRALALGAVAAGLAGLSLALVVWHATTLGERAESVAENPPASSRVLLGHFDNRTGDPRLDHLATAFRIGVESASNLSVLSPDVVREALARMERPADAPLDRALGLELCRRQGARVLLLPGLSRVDDTYVLSAEVIDAASGEVSFAVQESTRDPARLVRTLGELVAAVRAELGDGSAYARDLPRLEAVTTDRLEALEAYSEAWRLLQEDGSTQEEIGALLEHALLVDPDFATARLRLAVVFAYSGRPRGEVWRTLQEALANKERMTRFERLYAEAWSATLEGRRDEALRSWGLLAALFPDRRIGNQNLAMTHWTFDNAFPAAWAAFQEIPTTASDFDRGNWLRLGSWLAVALGREDAADWLALRLAEGRDSADLLSLLGALGDYGRAEQMQARLLAEASPRQDRSLASAMIRLAVDRGQLRRALEVHAGFSGEGSQPIAAFEWRVRRLPLLAALGERDAARREIAAAVEDAEALAAGFGDAPVNPSLAVGVAVLGKLAALAGDVTAAKRARQLLRSLADRLPPHASLAGYEQMLEAEIAALSGLAQAALARLEGAPLADAFQEHESRARLLAAAGRRTEAAAAYRWLLGHRGRVLMECLYSFQCFEMELNTLDWSRAHERLAELLVAAGRQAEAQELSAALTSYWAEGDAEIPELARARARLAATDRLARRN